MGLKDAYYSLEDKWFALLDWLEAKHINLYGIVDPLEKRGVPSLPVFIALFLIFIYALFTFILPLLGEIGGTVTPHNGIGLVVNIVGPEGEPFAGFAV